MEIYAVFFGIFQTTTVGIIAKPPFTTYIPDICATEGEICWYDDYDDPDELKCCPSLECRPTSEVVSKCYPSHRNDFIENSTIPAKYSGKLGMGI